MAAPPASRRGGGGADRLSPLPDEILAQILSFLPAQVAARTSVLARSWRGVWKLTRRLRITGTAEPESVNEVRGFVDRLLRLRLREIQRAPLDACEITLRDYDEEEDGDDVERWIRCAVECEVQTLRVDMYRGMVLPFLVANKPLVSPHLTRLVLCGVGFSKSFANFSRCLVLRDLEIQESDLWCVQRMRSPSLKHPDQNYCDLSDLMGCMGSGTSSGDNDEEESDDEAGKYSGNYVLLGGLLEAMNLTLLCTSTRCYIFRRDLRLCPTFWKLKTLVLDGYLCEPADSDCSQLACILQHAPVLEQLSVLFTSQVQPKYKVEMEGCLNAPEESALISQHLKIVKVKCGEVDERVVNILNFFGTLNIWFQFRRMF